MVIVVSHAGEVIRCEGELDIELVASVMADHFREWLAAKVKVECAT